MLGIYNWFYLRNNNGFQSYLSSTIPKSQTFVGGRSGRDELETIDGVMFSVLAVHSVDRRRGFAPVSVI